MTCGNGQSIHNPSTVRTNRPVYQPVQYFSVLFVKQQIPPRYLAILQFVQFQPCDSRLTSQDQTVLFILEALLSTESINR